MTASRVETYFEPAVPDSQRGVALPVSPGSVDAAVARTRDWLLEQQHADGYWVGELQGDTILESEFVLLLAFLGQGQSERAIACAEYIQRQQNPDGGWSAYPGGPTEISGAVKAYLALKITGHSPTAEYMQRGREAVLRAGGVERVNSFTRYYLAMLGLIPYEFCPAVPPELMLIPNWAPFNLYEMSAWSRTIIAPLSLLWAFKPCHVLPAAQGIDELYATPERSLPKYCPAIHEHEEHAWFSWTNIFRKLDGGLKLAERWGLMRLRQRSVRLAEQWILARQPMSDGLGAIFPPIIWTIIGLKSLGYADDHPVIQQQFDELDKLMLHEDGTTRLQPCLSPVWDTAIATIALRDAGVPRQHPALKKSVDWLLSKEVRHPGDWSLAHPDVEPGGWYFEFRNEFYPDVDDTAMVLIALSRCLPVGLGSDWKLRLQLDAPNRNSGQEMQGLLSGRSASADAALAELATQQHLVEAVRRGVQWLCCMQCHNGGWAAFDADNTREVFTKVPFADHNAMIDPPTADISARVLEAFAALAIDRSSPQVKRAIEFIVNDQCADGAWFGRWGVNYIYGTWQVIVGLVAMGVPPQDPRMQRGAQWLKQKQQSNGGWGETARTYDDPSLRGTGPTTASQTAWALLGLLAAGEGQSLEAQRAAEYLVTTQRGDGTWDEPWFTGTGFPKVFYLRYHLYRIYFPLMALARYRQACL